MPSALYSWTLAPLLRVARALAWIAMLGLAITALMLVGPRVVDWQTYKPRLVALLAETTGRPVSIDGPIDLALLPEPAIRLNDIKLGNAPGGASPYLFEARRVAARLSWQALLQGRVEVTGVALDEPRLAIEPATGDKPNWWLPLLDGADRDGPPLVPLSVDQVEIRKGRLVHATGMVGQPIEARSVDLVVRLEAAGKRIGASGSAVVNGVPVTLTLDLLTDAAGNPPVTLSFDAPGGRLSFTGWPGQRSQEDPLRGRAAVAATALPEFAGSLSRLMGRPPVRIDENLVRALAVSGDVLLAGERLSIEGLEIRTPHEQIRGALQVDWHDGLAFDGRLVSPALDADGWIERLQTGSLLGPGNAGSGGDLSDAGLRLQLMVEVGALRYRRDTVRDLTASFRYDNDAIHLQELRAILPGDFRIHRKVGFEGDQIHPGFDGVIEVDGRDLRTTLKWIGIDAAAVPADRLRTLRLAGRTRPVKGTVHVSDATFALDDQTGTATADVKLALPTVIAARIRMPRLDLDAYRLDSTAWQGMLPAPVPASTDPGLPPPLIDIAAALDEVIYRAEPARNVDARVLVRGNLLTLRHVGVGALLGSHLEISGTVNDFGTVPRFDLAWRGVLPDADRMLDYAGLPRFLNGRIGAAQLAGHSAGTLREAAVSNLSVSMLGTTITASGQVRFGDALGYDFPHWSLATHDIGALAGVATGGPPRPLAEVEATGAFHGDLHQAAFRGRISVDGMPLAGTVSSTLAARPRISLSLQAPEGLRLDRWLPVAQRSGAAVAVHSWSQQPTSRGPDALAGLRGIDGTFVLTSPAIHWGPYTLEGVDLSARLDRGLLRFDRLSAGFEGAALELSGTVDARHAVTGIALRGGLRDLDISRTIAIAHTANDFGSDDLAVALEGRMSLEDFALEAEGDGLTSFLLSARASGRTEGRFRPVVTRGSLSLASFATGIGSLFSTEMGFASAVIDGFVNRWIATRGTFDLAGGVLTLNEHTLQGTQATAYISSRIDLRHATLDTLIALDIGAPGSIDYTMSLRGPVGGPRLQPEPNRRR